MTLEVTLLGAGGHAKVVLSTLQAMGHRVFCVLDDAPESWGKDLLGVPIVGPIREAKGPCVIGIGANPIRKKLAQSLNHVEWVTVVHPYRMDSLHGSSGNRKRHFCRSNHST